MRYLVGLCLISIGGLLQAEWPRTRDITYMLSVYQTGSIENGLQQVATKVFNPSPAQSHKFGQPNAHAPWLHPGGVDGDDPDDLRFRRAVIMTLPSPVTVYTADSELPEDYEAPARLIHWTFPVGTQFVLQLYDENDVLFATHTSTKIRDGEGITQWVGEELLSGEVPAWYKSPDDCQRCHADVGRHGLKLLPGERDKQYYHWVRGSDGRFFWHPFEQLKGKQGYVKLRKPTDFVLLAEVAPETSSDAKVTITRN